MLSYQHIYHAGCFADVLKHIVLSNILDYMTQKESPLFYLETHGGRGLYDLASNEAKKTKEADLGVFPLWENQSNAPEMCSPFLKTLNELNPTSNMRFYPGSPKLAISQLRTQDRLFINELHPKEFQFLSQLRKDHKRVHYSQTDGIKQLESLLPPPEKRGLIFIDPSYELKEEYKTIPKAIIKAYNKFSNGVFCLWYPIIDSYQHQQLLNQFNKLSEAKTLRVEFEFANEQQLNMNGCGLWIINPPFRLQSELPELINYLKEIFKAPKANSLINVTNLK